MQVLAGMSELNDDCQHDLQGMSKIIPYATTSVSRSYA